MAHSDKPQPGIFQDQRDDNTRKSQVLSRDIEELNSSLRVDFDQKLGELSVLLARFKALVISPSKTVPNDNTTADGENTVITAALETENHAVDPEPVAPVNRNTIKDAARDAAKEVGRSQINEKPNQPAQATARTGNTTQPDNAAELPTASIGNTTDTNSRYASEPTRFESGLYKLNCQLYRFRLELDQELEFREEPLHVHFHQESDLSQVLQKISDDSREKFPDN